MHARMMRLEAQVAEAKGAVERERACEAENARLRSALARHEDIILVRMSTGCQDCSRSGVCCIAASFNMQCMSSARGRVLSVCMLSVASGLQEEFKRAAMLTAHCDASVTAAAAAEYQQATSTVQAHKEDLCRLLAHAGLPLDHVRCGHARAAYR